MKTTVPFTKDILFKSKIAEITSISLEHELNNTDTEITGNFIVSGDYKTHEVCVNKEEFLYKLPFNVELTDNIDLSTFNFEITDFYYDIIDQEILRVNIEFEVSAQEKKEESRSEVDVIFEKPEEEIMEVELDDNIFNKEIKDEVEEIEVLEVIDEKEDVREDIQSIEKVEEQIEYTENEESKEELNRLNEEETKTVLDEINNMNSDEFITYNVHIVRNIETFESIAEKYETTVEMLKEYNSNIELNMGDKIIIPQENNE